MAHHDVNINNYKCVHGLRHRLNLTNMNNHRIKLNKNVLVFSDLKYSLLLAKCRDDWRVRTNKSLKNNSIKRPPMPGRILLLDEITKLILRECINNVLQCLRLIDCLHH